MLHPLQTQKNICTTGHPQWWPNIVKLIKLDHKWVTCDNINWEVKLEPTIKQDISLVTIF